MIEKQNLMDEEKLRKLEFKVYRFSVNVFSFVKTLANRNEAITVGNQLLNLANEMYGTLADMLDSYEGGNKAIDFSSIQANSEVCKDLLQTIEVSGILINEKVDLLIEAHEISQKLIEITNKS
jgi:hypothetical protein